MRVTHVITRLIVGGAQENTISTVFGLHESGEFEVSLATGPTTGSEGSLEGLFTGREHLLVRVPHLVRAIKPLHEVRAYVELRRLFRLQRPLLVHTHSGKAGLLGRLAASHAGVPIIVHTIHGPSFGPFQGGAANAAFKAAERVAGRVTTHFVAVAEAMKRQYLEAGIGRPGQYSVIFSGFDLEPFANTTRSASLRARLGIPADAVVIGKIARLFELKGHEDLLETAPTIVRVCPRARFLFVGDGPLRREFEFKARRLGVEKHVVFAGLIPPTRVPDFVGAMDLLAHLSRREGLPRALPQALAAAVPVVAYDCDGASEVCLNEQTGLLVKPGDKAALEAALLRLTRDAVLRLNLGRAGQKLVRERFSVETMVERIARLYRELAATSRMKSARYAAPSL